MRWRRAGGRPLRRGSRTGTLSSGYAATDLKGHDSTVTDNAVHEELVGRGLCDQFAGFLERHAVPLAHDKGGQLAKLAQAMAQRVYITWNAKSWVLRWPLDQILPGQDFTLLSLEVLPAFGSDHRPYLAELCYDPAAGRDQSPPQLRPDDLPTARADVVRGRNTAESDSH